MAAKLETMAEYLLCETPEVDDACTAMETPNGRSIAYQAVPQPTESMARDCVDGFGATPVQQRVVPPLRSLVRNFSSRELLTAPTPRAFVWEPWIPADRVSILVGAGGTCKSNLMVRLAVHTILGESLFGGETIPSAVLYLTAEDRRADLQRHLFELLRRRSKAEVTKIGRQLHVLDANGVDVKLVRLVGRAALVTRQAQEVADIAKEIGTGLVILDTASRLNGAGEDNEALARLIEAGELIARDAGAAVVIVHHTGKAQMRDQRVDQYAGRGGSAMSDNARSVLHLATATGASKTSAMGSDKLLPAHEILILSHVKANYVPPAPPVHLHRQRGEYAACLVQLKGGVLERNVEGVWAALANWLTDQNAVKYPTRASIDGLTQFDTRNARRAALDFALANGLVREIDHPNPHRNAKKYLELPAKS